MKFNICGFGKKRAASPANTDIERLREKETFELLDELEEKLDAGEDVELIDKYLEVLDEKAPVLSDFDPEASLAEFKSRHPLIFNNAEPARKPRAHRSLRRLAVIAAVLASVFAIMLVAQASGVNIFGRLGQWTDEIFSFGSIKGESEAIKELKAGLDEKTLSVIELPSWLPDGFELIELELDSNIPNDSITASVYNGEKWIYYSAYSVDTINEGNNSLLFEKDAENVISYEKNGRTFYTMENLSWQVAAWEDGYYEYYISGQIERDELIDILDSI